MDTELCEHRCSRGAHCGGCGCPGCGFEREPGDPRGPIQRELRHVCGCPCRCEFECAFGVRCPTAHGDSPPFVE